MQHNSVINNWLDHLYVLMPPKGVMLVGAGTGHNSWTYFLRDRKVSEAILVESEPTRFEKLRQSCSEYPNWRLYQEVIAERGGEVAFHEASISTESGLLPPEEMRGLWPNLYTRRTEICDAISLNQLCSRNTLGITWLWIDCLPAPVILAGATELLENVDLICARVIVENSENTVPTRVNLTAIRCLLEPLGFQFLVFEPGKHPQMGKAIFIRPLNERLRNQVECLIQEKISLEKTTTELQAKLRIAGREISKAEAQIKIIMHLGQFGH